MPKKRNKTSKSSKQDISRLLLFSISLILLVIVYYGFISGHFSLNPRATSFGGGILSNNPSYKCQQVCVANYQCGQGQICARKPGSPTAQKYCYNAKCPNDTTCTGKKCDDNTPTPTPTNGVIRDGMCRAMNHEQDPPYQGPDVHMYGSEQECMQRCAQDYPGRICRLINPLGSPNPDADRIKKYCIPNLCTYDGMSIWEAGIPRKLGSAYTVVRKNNSCPARDFNGCLEGFSCEKITGGMKITRISDFQGQDDYPWFITRNCPCQENIIRSPYGYELSQFTFCEDFNHDWMNRGDLEIGQSLICLFDTLKCARYLEVIPISPDPTSP